MTTQLRLVEALPEPRRTEPTPPARRRTPTGQFVARRSGGTSTRRAVQWGEWELDARTRLVGRRGVAAARLALEHSPAKEALSRAS